VDTKSAQDQLQMASLLAIELTSWSGLLTTVRQPRCSTIWPRSIAGTGSGAPGACFRCA